MPDVPLKVLCVDDNYDVVRSTADVLCLAGFDARACTDPASAAYMASQIAPDVCVLDLNMPRVGGAALAAAIRAVSGGRPVRFVAMSGEDNPGGTWFEVFLVKPADPAALIAAVTGPEPVPGSPNR